MDELSRASRELTDLARKQQRAAQSLTQATMNRDSMIRYWHNNGVSGPQLMVFTGLSRPMIYKILNG